MPAVFEVVKITSILAGETKSLTWEISFPARIRCNPRSRWWFSCRCSARGQSDARIGSGRRLLGNTNEHIGATDRFEAVEDCRVGPIGECIGNIGKVGDIQPGAADEV